jgi:cytochrome c-type biogenesis protein CcmH/NrfG
MSDTYKNNLAALGSRFPDIYQRIVQADSKLPFHVKTCVNAVGQSNAWWSLPGGREVPFYEEDDIIGHIDKQSAEWQLENNDFLFCIGMGLGYLPLVVSQIVETQPGIVVFEPHLAIFDLALQHVDLRPLIRYHKLDLIIGSTVSIQENILKYKDRIFFGKIKLISHGPSRLIFGKRFEAIEKEVVDNIQLVRNKSYTAKAAGTQILSNTVTNLTSVFCGPDLGRLKNLFKGFPAVCVAAGPSLDKDLEHLKRIGDRAAILCCDSAVHTLVSADIHPHLVVTADRNPVNYDKIRYDMDQLRDSVLVFGAEANPDNVRGFLGPRRFAISADSVLLNRWLGPQLGLNWQLPAMTAVSHTAIFTAMILGADPVVLVGMDFAFVTGRSHAQGSVFRYSTHANAMMPVDGLKGYPVQALPQLISDRRQIENCIADSDTRFIDASLDGARIRGTETRSLEEIVMTMLNPLGDITRRLNSVAWGPCIEIERVVQTLEDMVTSIQQFCKTCQQNRLACFEGSLSKSGGGLPHLSRIRNGLERFEQRYDLLLRILKMVRYADVQELTGRLEHLRESQEKGGNGSRDFLEEMDIYAAHYASLEKASNLFETLLKTKLNDFQRESVLNSRLKSESQADRGLLAVAEHFRQIGETWQAEPAYRTYLEYFPNDVSSWLALGRIYADAGLWPTTYRHLVELKKKFPTDVGVDGFEKWIVQRMSHAIEQATNFLAAGNIDSARRSLVEVLSVFPENEKAIALKEKLHSIDEANEKRLSQHDACSNGSIKQRALQAKAIQYLREGETEWGIGILEGLAEASPDEGCRYREWVGDIRFESNDHVSAAWNYRKALKVSPEKQPLEKKLQAAVRRQADTTAGSAGNTCEPDGPSTDEPMLSHTNFTEPEALYFHAQQLIGRGKPGQAIKSLQHLLSIKPDFALAHNDLGVLFFNQGNPAKAEVHYHAAAQIDPHNPTFQKNLADFTYFFRGKVRDALEIYVKLLAKNPVDVELLSTIGQICLNEGQHADADAFFRQALEIDPTNNSVQQRVALLKTVKEG